MPGLRYKSEDGPALRYKAEVGLALRYKAEDGPALRYKAEVGTVLRYKAEEWKWTILFVTRMLALMWMFVSEKDGVSVK